MSRKPEAILNELAAQLFPFCAGDYESMNGCTDGTFEMESLPVFMDKAVSAAQTLLPADEVYVAKRISLKMHACVDEAEDMDKFVSDWFCSIVLDLDSTKEFWARFVA